MTAEADKFTAERRDRLAGAIVGAPGNELVVVRVADLRACLGMADAIADANQLIGANERLERELANSRAIAAQVPILRDQITGLQGRVQTLLARVEAAARLLKGGDA